MWTSAKVLERSARWTWVPYDAVRVETVELTVVVTPQGKGSVLRFQDGDVDEAVRLARQSGARTLTFSVHEHTRPASLASQLRERGATVDNELDVSALDLTGGVPDLAVPQGIEVRRVDDPLLLADVYKVDGAAFGSPYPTKDFQRADAERLRTDPSVMRYLAYAGGQTVGSAGLTQEGPVGLLWGGGVLEAFRGKGIYRALLHARLTEAVAQNSELALVKARVGTSAPILRRAGFTAHGKEWHLTLALA